MHISRKIKSKVVYHVPVVRQIRFKLKRNKSFAEKIEYRQKYKMDNPKWAPYIDKLLFKEYAQSKGVESPRTIAILEEFDIDKIPENCVIKMNNGSRRNIIVQDGKIVGGFGQGKTLSSQLDEIKKIIDEWQKPYNPIREPQYKYIEPKLFIEELMYPIPEDYKFFVFHGEVKIIQLHKDRFSSHCRSNYDRNWNDTGCRFKDLNPCTDKFPRPDNLQQLIQTAEKLAPPIDFIRVDLYNIDGKILAGELTFTPDAGRYEIQPEECDRMFSSWW